MDDPLPRMTLFLHEDLLARTLAYEQELQQWRVAELEAGRGDPGRPTYEEASGRLHSFGGTPHHYFRHSVVHQSHNIAATLREALAIS